VRDIVLLFALLAISPVILRAPQTGILAWIWVSLLNPQQEVYGFLSSFQLNFYIVLLTATGWAVSKEKKTVPANMVTGFLILFGLWTCVTTHFALQPDFSAVIQSRTLKTIALALAIIALTNNKARVQTVIWAVVLSLGYYAVKGGGFVLLTGGRHHVFGPENTMIADNNALGLALVMLLPLLNYLRVTSRSRFTAYCTIAVMVLTLVAIVGTYSRGALVALAASGVAYVLKSRSGVIPLLLGGMLAVALPSIVPSSWFERMATIQSYHDDSSFDGRVAAWRTSFEIALQRPLIGGGFSSTSLDWVTLVYHTPGSLDAGKAAHSIYFQVLGDHGFVGLALYLLLLASAWINTSAIVRATRDVPQLDWANRLARMLQVSMVGYLVGGAALSMAYYDGFLILIAVTAALAIMVRQPQAIPASRRPHWLKNPPQTAIPIGASLPGWRGPQVTVRDA
jgi:probable O-glycosylation ligase (exosortase A-associated)